MRTSRTISVIRRILLSVFFNLLPLILCPLYPILLVLLVLPCLVCRFFNRLNAKIFRPDLGGMTDGISQCLISDRGRWSSHGFNALNTSVVNGHLRVESLVKLVETQVLPLEEYKALKAYPVRFWGYLHWKPDVSFKIKNHIRRYDSEENQGSSPRSEEDLKRILGDLLGSPWKRGQSLWEIVVLNNYFSKEDEEKKDEKSVIVLRMHHFMGDGYSIVGLFKKLCTGDSTISVASTYKGRTRRRMIAEHIAAPYFHCRFANALLRRGSGLFFVNKEWSGDGCSYLMTWTEAISVEEVSEVKKKFGVSFQAVVHALISGATYKFLKELGHKPPQHLIVAQPRFLPGHPGGLSNHAAPGAISLPLGERDTIRKLQLCHKELVSVTEATSPEFLVSQTNMLYSCPYSEFFQPMKGIWKGPFVLSVTGCPGPRGPILIDDKEVERFSLSVGQVNYLSDASITLCTALGKMTLAFVVRKHFCSDPKVLEKFNVFLVEEMQELLKAKPLETVTAIEA